MEKLQVEAEIWALVNSLFGNPQIDLSSYITEGKFSKYRTANKNHELTMAEINVLRINLFSNWLKISNQELEENIEEGGDRGALLRGIAAALTRNDLKKALELATAVGIQTPLFGLASLFCSSTGRVKELILEQFAKWDQDTVNRVINPDIKAIYDILIHARRHNGNYDWRRQFGMCLWYECQQKSALKEVFHVFKEIEKGNNERYLQPKYLKWSEKPVKDICYKLIEAYASEKSFPFDSLFEPKSYTSDHTEYKLVWLISYMLRTLLYSKGESCALDIMEIKSKCKDVPISAVLLANRVIEEFELLGYWHWAILVCLLSKDTFRPMDIFKKIEELLTRNIEDLNSSPEKEELIRAGFLIPITMISRSKGIYYMSMKRWGEAIKYLEEAEEWNLVHKVLWDNIVPGLIASKEKVSAKALAFIKEILSTLKKHKGTVPEWENRGNILKMYLEILEGNLNRENEAAYLKMIKEISTLLRKISEVNRLPTDDMIFSRIVDRLRKMAGKIQSEYYELTLKSREEKELERIVPIPLEAEGSIGIAVDERIIEEGIARMIYRACRSQF